MKVVCITNDVEATTIQGDAYNNDIANRVRVEALPKVLALYKKYNVKATFFCQGSMIEQFPDIVEMIENDGHEVACHGWIHDSDKAFDVLSYKKQFEHLQNAKKTIDTVAKRPVVSFRAPALRVNGDTPKALKNAGFKYDSSVASQRMDAFMSLGSKKKLQWIKAPREVYEASIENLARKGNGGIIEVPVSAFGFPYISTLMRISPLLTSITRWFLLWETKRNNNKVVTFLFHPGEVLNNQWQKGKTVRRTKNPIAYFFSGIIRANLKRRNLGDNCLTLLEKELKFWKEKGYCFSTISELNNKEI